MCVIKSTLLKFNEETFLRSSLIIYASSRYSWYFSHNSWDKMCVWRYMFSLANKLMIVKWTCKQFREDEGNKGNNKGKGDWDWHMYTIYILYIYMHQFSWVQLLSRPTLCDPMNGARQASLSITNSWSSPKLMCIESVMPSSHLILCHPLLLPPPIPTSIRVFSNESTLCCCC